MTIGHRTIPVLLLTLLASVLGGLTPACSGPANPHKLPTTSPAPTAETAPRPVQPTETSAPGQPGPIPTPFASTLRPTVAAATVPPPPLATRPSPHASPSPTAVAFPLRPPTPPAAAEFAPAPERDLFRLAAELSLPTDYPEIPRVVNAEPVSYTAGKKDRFWLVDTRTLKSYQSQFELRLVSPRAYWYVEQGRPVRQSDLERAAAEFEAVIYPRVTAYFGQEWTPGVDNDPHLTIVHGKIRGAAGYFSSTDEYPVSVRPRSNQREMIYLNIDHLPVGSDPYLNVLAHELQHAIHWNHDPSDDSWISEGLAELAVTVAGYQPASMQRFMQRPFVSLVHWPIDDANIGAHYGGASLFMHYLAEHYSSYDRTVGGDDKGNLRQLLTEPADNIAGIDAYLSAAGYDATFHTAFQNWVVANFLDKEQGIYGYSNLEVQVQPGRLMNKFAELNREVAQYGTHYIEIAPKLHDRPLRFRFEGAAENQLLPTEVAENGCWWSNSGDSITSSLTRSVDLRNLTQATLSYQIWYSIEKEWDYGYVQVSEDGGRHWDLLEAPHTSAANPIGAAFGPGYTGKSRGWVSESVDLSRYAGQEILVRFQYVTDDALNGIGLCLQEIALPEAGISANDLDWQSQGFIKTDNRVRQDYIVQIIQQGAENRVTNLALTADGYGSLLGEAVVEPLPGLKRTLVAVSAVAPRTRQKAAYQLSLTEASP